jgi:hypothetical protein
MPKPALRLSLAVLLAAVLASLLGACNSTGLAESWVEPSLKELPRFHRVFVAYLGVDASAQRQGEDALAKHVEEGEVVKCYTLFPDSRDLDPVRMKDELRKVGCDGAIVMRLAGVEQEVSYTPGTYPPHYRSFGGYWGYAYPATMDVRTDEIAHVETNVYSLADDKLIYAARSETFNPGSSAGMVDEIAAAILEDLEEKGLWPPAGH